MAPKSVSIPAKGSVGVPPILKSGKINWKAGNGKYESYLTSYLKAYPDCSTKKLLKLTGWEALSEFTSSLKKKIEEIKTINIIEGELSLSLPLSL